MTLVKRPTLERQRTLLGIEPLVSLAEGVRRVCAVQRQMVAGATSGNGHGTLGLLATPEPSAGRLPIDSAPPLPRPSATV
jgi:hypothetical protein